MASAAVAAAAAPLRRSLLPSLNPSCLFSSLASSSHRLSLPRALRPAGPLPSDVEDSDDSNAGDGAGEALRKSRNDLKREARRAVQWGMDLAKFSPLQIKRILRAASLDREVFDALMLVKRFGSDVREGKRRQFNYIGRLLRGAQPELMDTLIQYSKDGDDNRLLALMSENTFLMEDEEIEDLPCNEEEGDKEHIEIADRWFEGLLSKDISVTNEIYAIHNVEFDRQELRKLVRTVHMVQDNIENEHEEESTMKLLGAKKQLLCFLRSIAKEAYVKS
ncbi:uncharacterized protein [Oryza sativa Japonica Group]|uniref:OSJNBb0026I12.6 protein n=2 Tax=Oryza sativa subsp. japonica TaxID=39947 RepID=A3AS84_ORYSJ|nr:uncharacterized protein LOC4335309 [Oryza sativa Japonica Group]XP_052152382.1 uncharacterized protein LOC127770630 isoform X2 [Oryza glaberrima]EAZ30173.1 hypothetical protein OsJ_14229 [Oryza sativa Japonica Group]KAF2933079.1 hypothetical protein DAI22_04g055500 [Oryza sativa Japonica Group]CAE03898.2 OSJNBb0026I12.6 [Oryza sativa Japonica Group]BAF14229.1 Os04g0250700 [Oryza sativa Japonica Group]BAG90208.1 unnamed protein product [Oryza sativa Japonica Group]|eukprot:NP_001052315.1 Os04g0250700 [Oryza sativa Japonica Group]